VNSSHASATISLKVIGSGPIAALEIGNSKTGDGEMSERHGTVMRGLEAAGHSPQFQGRFGKLFPKLPPAQFGTSAKEEQANLKKLADLMISQFDAPKDSPDDEESGIPALYTYLGQFIDHDITFDPDASFQKQKDPSAKIDFRSPAFDLDNVYGRGPGDQPYLYDQDGKSFLLGDPITQGVPPGAHDLQRNGAGRALIGDPRNDENVIVSQLQGLFLRFHNRLVAENKHLPFEKVQEQVRHHYQYIVVNDFLPRIVRKSVLDDLKSSGSFDKSKLKVFTDFANPFMPVEFSVAAYRLGHSMIRPGYRLNDTVLLPIFPLPADETTGVSPFPEGLTGFRRLISDWAIDWGRFIDIDERSYGSSDGNPTKSQLVQNFSRLQFAYRIDTALVDPLKNLPSSVVNTPPPSLALRNLLRGREFGLPSGQVVAKALGVPVLADKDIKIGQGIDNPKPGLKNIVELAGTIFAGNCPLWTYILAEAMDDQAHITIPVKEKKIITTPQLGPVGGRIVAEVFIGLMFADPGSYLTLNPGWTPATGKTYALKDFVRFALG
jgi:hypothetical protein